ncbi:hypothetical protein E4U02_14905 [Microbacterium paludicola]|uniref:Uncharacterized protein n=1 Tax=Microbacterium paludicola TaxID=300019 RepID=A0A4Y9FMI2_9MICO|nr:hypothetical protein [Microbacterium paludicola]MBF0817693.1 hypothetical protein [Microbacterium paludicola]TFU30226.1 hypothetical protein E4U02_14905 [Microbacterium paludicola]
MKSMGTRKSARTLGIAAALALGATFLVAAPAAAASWTSISGTVFSDSDAWYYSSVIRTKRGGGKVSAKFSNLPACGSSANTQLRFAITKPGTQTLIGGIQYFPVINDERTLASSVADGTQFRTTFSRYLSCTNSDHNFSGSLYY